MSRDIHDQLIDRIKVLRSLSGIRKCGVLSWAYKQDNCARCFKGSVRFFFTTDGLSWENVVGICTDGAPAMLGSRSGFLKLAKKHNPNIVGTHCMIIVKH